MLKYAEGVEMWRFLKVRTFPWNKAEEQSWVTGLKSLDWVTGLKCHGLLKECCWNDYERNKMAENYLKTYRLLKNSCNLIKLFGFAWKIEILLTCFSLENWTLHVWSRQMLRNVCSNHTKLTKFTSYSGLYREVAREWHERRHLQYIHASHSIWLTFGHQLLRLHPDRSGANLRIT